jgi:branched-chain amino acid aminotransferase
VNKLNENGLVIDIYPDARKSCDAFSNLKSANFLPYTMAAQYAKENKLNDCLVLNSHGNIADFSIANVFIIQDRIIITPALKEGCVNGIMRRFLLGKMQNGKDGIVEASVSVTDLEKADEVFLTNAINGIRWVRQFRDKIYSNIEIKEIYDRYIKKNLIQ